MKNITKCFPGGRHKVLTMSYDDGRSADRRLVNTLNQYGIKGTFHLNSGFLGDSTHVSINEIKELYKGHEVAAHTYHHPTIARCSVDHVVQQIIKDREILEDIVGYTVRGFSYPNGSYNRDIINILSGLGIEYGRVVGNSENFSLPEDYYTWKATCHHKHDLMPHAKTFTELKKKQHWYMFYVWGHSYEFDADNNWELMEEFCEYMGNREEIWYATNIEIVDYLNALKRLKFSVKGDFVYNPSAMTVWLSADEKIVEVPGGIQKQL